MHHAVVLAFLMGVAGCGGEPPDDVALELGQEVEPQSCDFKVTTPEAATRPVKDDGKAPIGIPKAAHLSWAGDPATSISIVWTTGFDTRGTRIEWGVGDALDKKAAGFSFAYGTDLAGTQTPTVRVHEIHLCGLQPDTAYRWQIPGTTVGGTFATAPKDARPFRFAVGGDSRGAAMHWGMMLDGINSRAPEFALYTGDAVNLGFLQEEWDAWFAAGESVLPNLPLQFAAGNHEVSARHFFAQFALGNNEQWYAFDYGDARFIVLDDTPKVDTTIETEQRAFLEKELSATSKTWKIVMHHKAVYSSSNHGSQLRLQQAWMDLYDQYKVDVVFNGHDHDFERTRPMRAGVPDSPGGTIYMVNGGGGAPLYNNGTSQFTAISKKTHGYTLVDLAASTMTLTTYDDTHTEIDRYQIQK